MWEWSWRMPPYVYQKTIILASIYLLENDGSISVLIDKRRTFCNHTWLWETILSISRKEDKCFSFTLGYVSKRWWQLVFCWLAYTPLTFKMNLLFQLPLFKENSRKYSNQDAWFVFLWICIYKYILSFLLNSFLAKRYRISLYSYQL